MAQPTNDQQLVQQTIAGDVSARKKVNEIAHPLISYQTRLFCKRFCKDNIINYQCTLPGTTISDNTPRPFCEWGNASYSWMLDDIASNEKLSRYQATNQATLKQYLSQIVHSLPFYERWKNWRFERRIYVPDYIQAIHKKAHRIFYAMKSGDSTEIISQAINETEQTVSEISYQILAELTSRNKLHILQPRYEFSINQQEESETSSIELPSNEQTPDTSASNLQLAKAWQQLNSLEQFVLESLVIDNQDANDVLAAIHAMAKSVGTDELSQKLKSIQNRQQLYYFKRKALCRLHSIFEK